MKEKLIWILFTLGVLFTYSYFLFTPAPDQAGDIVEYYGVTESILNHGSIDLTEADKQSLSKTINPQYFDDPQYYLEGKNGKQYPVHFPLYSILVTPIRLLLEFLKQNPLKAFAITNITIFAAAVWYLLAKVIKSSEKKLFFLATISVSPFISFLSWPGPDILYGSLIMLAVFNFFKKNCVLAALFAVIASWQASALSFLALAFIGWTFFCEAYEGYDLKFVYIKFRPIIAGTVLLLLVLLAIPYIQNYLTFGVLSPWTILPSGWTKLYGFGFQNITLKKLYEIFFDFNIGLFWYAPLITLGGLFYIGKQIIRKNIPVIFLSIIFLITAIVYQTNPAWHNGTAGYGPGRYSLIFLPLFIYGFLVVVKPKLFGYILFALTLITQIAILSWNGYLRPYFPNTNYHSYAAHFVLQRYPKLYNPTPEIFVDRTTHTDINRPQSAIYKIDSECKKAYILKTDTKLFTQECGNIPETFKDAFDNELLKKTNYARKVTVESATFWPDDYACGEGITWKESYPYICMRTLYEVMQNTGITDEKRIQKIPEYPGAGIWRITTGEPIKITVPSGYFIHYNALDGIYVTY